MKLRDYAQFCCAFHLAWCFMKETDIGCFVFSTSSDFRPREPMECCPFRSPIAYRKIPKISPGAYIFQRPCLRGLFLEGLIFGGAYVRREICVSKSNGLPFYLGVNLPCLLCFTLYLRAIFQVQAPGGLIF